MTVIYLTSQRMNIKMLLTHVSIFDDSQIHFHQPLCLNMSAFDTLHLALST